MGCGGGGGGHFVCQLRSYVCVWWGREGGATEVPVVPGVQYVTAPHERWWCLSGNYCCAVFLPVGNSGAITRSSGANIFPVQAMVVPIFVSFRLQWSQWYSPLNEAVPTTNTSDE